MSKPEKNYGQINYEAYCNHTGGVSLISGQRLPAWSTLKPEIQAAWEHSADEVNMAYLEELGEEQEELEEENSEYEHMDHDVSD